MMREGEGSQREKGRGHSEGRKHVMREGEGSQ